MTFHNADANAVLRNVMASMRRHKFKMEDWAMGYYGGQLALLEVWGQVDAELLREANQLRLSLAGKVPVEFLKKEGQNHDKVH